MRIIITHASALANKQASCLPPPLFQSLTHSHSLSPLLSEQCSLCVNNLVTPLLAEESLLVTPGHPLKGPFGYDS